MSSTPNGDHLSNVTDDSFEEEGSQIQHVRHLSELIDRYSVFVFPIFGTLHNGQSLCEEAFTCLKKLSEHRKTVAIFSNVPKRRHVLIQDLANLGVSPSLYQHVITSGEEAFHALNDRTDPFHARLKEKCFVLGAGEALKFLDGLNLQKTMFMDEADFILSLGPDEWHAELDYYKPILERAKGFDLPMVCVSPDLYVEFEGNRSIRAGALAQYYESLGGDVFYHGKPYRPFYRSLLKDLEPFQKSDVLILGDSYLTDIKGASRVGIDSMLCLSDTTQIDFEISGLAKDYQKRLKNLTQSQEGSKVFATPTFDKILAEQDYVPTYMMEKLQW